MLTEVYKTTRGENPIFMNKICFVFRATQLWNQVPDSTKNEPNAKCFKAKLTRNWLVIKCTCTSCR